MSRNVKNKQKECPECHRLFEFPTGIRTHMRRAHGIPKAESKGRHAAVAPQHKKRVVERLDVPEIITREISLPLAGLPGVTASLAPAPFSFEKFAVDLTRWRQSIPQALEHLRQQRAELGLQINEVDHHVAELERISAALTQTEKAAES